MLARLVSLALLLAVLSPATAAGQDLKVLLIAEEDSSPDLEYVLTREVSVMTEMLKEAGFEVVVASASGRPLVADETTLEPDFEFAEVKVGDYAGMILPCMAVERTPPIEPELAALIQEAVAQGKPVAAQFGGIDRLGQAGVLSGKRFSYVEDYVAENPALENGVYSGTYGVVQDGNIITSGVCPFYARESGLPDGTPELTQRLIANLQGSK